MRLSGPRDQDLCCTGVVLLVVPINHYQAYSQFRVLIKMKFHLLFAIFVSGYHMILLPHVKETFLMQHISPHIQMGTFNVSLILNSAGA